jgi:NADH-quinone oxidoreductase subunit M
MVTAYPVLSLSIFLPLVGAAAILAFSDRMARWLGLGTTVATLAVSLPLYVGFDKSSSALQFVERVPWIPSWNVVYGVGVDGISLLFVFLSTVVSILCVAVSWTAIQVRVREYYAALLVAETAMIGVFAATNFFLFYVFWELMIVPVFLLIGVWGSADRVRASIKFLLFTLAGSVLMLVGLIALLQTTGRRSGSSWHSRRRLP